MLFIFGLLCWQATGLHAFSASTSTPNVVVKENNGADLKCDYSADFGSAPRVEWRYRSPKGSQSFIYFDGQITEKYKGYISQYNGGLTIHNTTRQDTGDYICEVSGNSGYAEAVIKLTVLGLHAFSASTSTPKILIKENNRADLKCDYSADFGSAPRVEWKYRSPKGSQSFIYFDGQITEKYKGYITQYNGGLTIQRVTRQDTGDYICEVSGNSGYAEAVIKLTVLVPPSVPISRVPTSAMTGSTVLLTCSDKDGSPPSTYKWYKNGTPMPEDPNIFEHFKYNLNPRDGSLDFLSVSAEDSGSYYCEASNGQGAPQRSSPMTMEVLSFSGLHAFSASTSTPNVMVKENNRADLKCDYSADFGSAPRVEWKYRSPKGSQSFIYFDGQITEKYKGYISQYSGGLMIHNTTRQDTGDYICEVSGNSGYAEAVIKLTVLVPPSVPISQVPTSATTGRNVLLTCLDKDGSPPSTYKWYKNGTPMPEDPSKFPNFKNFTYKLNPQNGNLEFPSVSPADSGSYYCEASNGQGAPQRSSPVTMEVR